MNIQKVPVCISLAFVKKCAFKLVNFINTFLRMYIKYTPGVYCGVYLFSLFMRFMYNYLVYLQGESFIIVEIWKRGVGALGEVLSYSGDYQVVEYTPDIHKMYTGA